MDALHSPIPPSHQDRSVVASAAVAGGGRIVATATPASAYEGDPSDPSSLIRLKRGRTGSTATKTAPKAARRQKPNDTPSAPTKHPVRFCMCLFSFSILHGAHRGVNSVYAALPPYFSNTYLTLCYNFCSTYRGSQSHLFRPQRRASPPHLPVRSHRVGLRCLLPRVPAWPPARLGLLTWRPLAALPRLAAPMPRWSRRSLWGTALSSWPWTSTSPW